MPFVAAAMDFQMMRPDVVAFSNYQGMKYRLRLATDFRHHTP